ncbi:MAG TPA: hypothetical protein VGR97_10520, partial [Candidatus Acidoferrales bacterium]|nr:hypothetical protein [Candidatus Acidoferrales bacterium]
EAEPRASSQHLDGRCRPRVGPSSAKAASLGMPILVESAQVQSSLRDFPIFVSVSRHVLEAGG